MLWIFFIGSFFVGVGSLFFGLFDLLERDLKSVWHNVKRIAICVVVFFVSAFCLGAIGSKSYQETEKLPNMNLYHYRIIAKYLALPVVDYFMYMLLWIPMKFICIITSLVMDTGKAELLLKM